METYPTNHAQDMNSDKSNCSRQRDFTYTKKIAIAPFSNVAFKAVENVSFSDGPQTMAKYQKVDGTREDQYGLFKQEGIKTLYS